MGGKTPPSVHPRFPLIPETCNLAPEKEYTLGGMEAIWLFLVSTVAGGFGVMLGLGGGIILVPALTLLFHQDLQHAVAASLVGVVATSCSGVQTYLAKELIDLRLGVALLVPTVIGAIAGAKLGTVVSPQIVAGLFSVLLCYITYQLIRARHRDSEEEATECFQKVPGYKRALGFFLSFGAGVISALLGVGGGILQVPMLHLLLGEPLRSAIATSTFLIGATASTSALIYLAHGSLLTNIVVPCALGVLLGARFGSRLALVLPMRVIRPFFAIVALYTAYRMVEKWFF